MGKSRDQLIKSYGGTPFSETEKSQRQAGLEAIARHLASGDLPPLLQSPQNPENPTEAEDGAADAEPDEK